MRDVGGFDHNAHTLRTLTRIEQAYPGHVGLNLSWETLEGLAKHNGPIHRPNWALAEIDRDFPLDLATWPSLEAQVAAVADDIAYDNHDIDDGLRAGLLTIADVREVPLVDQGWQKVSARYPGETEDSLARELVREQIGLMVNDVIDETRRRIAEARPGSADAVRLAGRPLAGFSEGLAAQERALKQFMYARLYRRPRQIEISQHAATVIAGLAERYMSYPDLLPNHWRASLPPQEPERSRHIGDFIAGMTDRYALSRYREVVGPIEMPDGF